MSATDRDSESDAEAESGTRTEPDPDLEHEPELEPNPNAEAAVTELPPSAKLVYKVLEYEGSLTQDEIAGESRLCSRTVRYALDKLEGQELVASRVCLEDARQSKYWIPE